MVERSKPQIFGRNVDYATGRQFWLTRDTAGCRCGIPRRSSLRSTPPAEHPDVISVLGRNGRDEGERLAKLLLALKLQRFITDFAEAVTLLPSVGIPFLIACDEERGGSSAGKELHRRGISSPSAGCVLIATIRQSKGQEWSVVSVGNLPTADLRLDEMEVQLGLLLTTTSTVPASRAGQFGRARQRYLAFSPAQHLLVLSVRTQPHPVFRPIWDTTPNWTPTWTSNARSQWEHSWSPNNR